MAFTNFFRSLFRPMLITVTCLLILQGCSTYHRVTVSVDENIDFTNYKTFAWLPDKTDTTNLPYNNEIIRNNIRNYFGQCFAERGYAVELDTPDVLLRLVVTVKEKEDWIYPTFPRPYFYCRYYYGSAYYFPYHIDYYYHHHPSYCVPFDYCANKIEYYESAITLHVIDRKRNTMVWSGTAKGDVYDPSFNNVDIHPAVIKIMQHYPVKPISPMKRKLTENDDIYKIISKN